eukprot:3557004-Amphidinium_carterae.1
MLEFFMWFFGSFATVGVLLFCLCVEAPPLFTVQESWLRTWARQNVRLMISVTHEMDIQLVPSVCQ